MSTEEASKIARHYLGEYLRYVVPVESGYNVLIHLKDGGYTSAFATEAEDLPAVCREAAAQLRAAGWSPSHARLEWTREFDDFSLVFHYDALPVKLWSGKLYSNGTGWAFNDSSGNLYNGSPLPKAEIVRIIAEWCATNLPSLHLPPFPETPHA